MCVKDQCELFTQEEKCSAFKTTWLLVFTQAKQNEQMPFSDILSEKSQPKFIIDIFKDLLFDLFCFKTFNLCT